MDAVARLEEAIRDAVARGWRNAHDVVTDPPTLPTPDQIQAAIVAAVLADVDITGEP